MVVGGSGPTLCRSETSLTGCIVSQLQFNPARLARAPATHPALPWAALVVGVVVAAAALLGGAVGGPLLRVFAAGAAVALVHRGWVMAAGRERQVRGWILLGAAVWFVSEVARLVVAMTGRQTLLAELGVVVLAIAGSYVAAARRRMGPADEASLYLDALAIFGTTTGGVVVMVGSLVDAPAGVAVLAHGAFFLAVMASTLLLNVTTRVPLRHAVVA